jgi:hypothetical protein
MATVKLSEYECERDLLPQVCAFCGEPAVTRVKRNFAWHPPWVWILILVNVLIAAVVAMILTKKMAVRVPVCDLHEGFWRRKGIVLSLTFAVIVVYVVGWVLFAIYQGPGQDELTGWLCAGGVVLLLVWLVIAAVWNSVGVRPSEITDRFIRLAGVHGEFIAALEDDRERDREDEYELRRKRRARRDEAEREREEPRHRDRSRDDDDLNRRAGE